MTIVVEKTQVLTMTPDEAWALIGDPADLARWIDGFPKLEMKGDVRTIPAPEGPPTVERIVAKDDAQRTYTYEYVSGALPLETYRSTLSVEPHEDGALVRWAAKFTTPADKAEWLTKRINRSYENALVALAKRTAK